jgi:DNA end-binding protein Ku
MPRPIWSGSISFGLVNIPVKLFSATQSHRVAFHEFEEGTGQRIRHKRVAEKSGREVPYEKIVKGFSMPKGRVVVLSNDEIDAAEPHKSRTVDIEQFVQLDEIDPITWDASYYVAPDGEGAARAYALLRQAMEDRKRVAIGRFVMRTKEYLVCLRPLGHALCMETMFFADEVRDINDVAAIPKNTRVGGRELEMAGHLIDGLTRPWNPSKFTDSYRDRVMKIVAKKSKGQEIQAVAEGEEPAEVIDLMSALRATLEGNKRSARRPARAAHERKNGVGRHRTKRRSTRARTAISR